MLSFITHYVCKTFHILPNVALFAEFCKFCTILHILFILHILYVFLICTQNKTSAPSSFFGSWTWGWSMRKKNIHTALDIVIFQDYIYIISQHFNFCAHTGLIDWGVFLRWIYGQDHLKYMCCLVTNVMVSPNNF